MTDIDAMAGIGTVLAALGAGAGLRWLAGAKVRQIEGLIPALHTLQMEIIKLSARLDRAEAEIANDKAGRRAFAAVEMSVSKISSDVAHIATDLQKLSERHDKGAADIWTAIDRLRNGKEAA